MDFKTEENYEMTELLMKLIDNIKALQKETVIARGKVVSLANEIESRNWYADMYSNLSEDYSDSELYHQFIEQIYDGKDPLDSEEWTKELNAIVESYKNNPNI